MNRVFTDLKWLIQKGGSAPHPENFFWLTLKMVHSEAFSDGLKVHNNWGFIGIIFVSAFFSSKKKVDGTSFLIVEGHTVAYNCLLHFIWTLVDSCLIGSHTTMPHLLIFKLIWIVHCDIAKYFYQTWPVIMTWLRSVL